jgi:hypothetical protein
MNSKCKAAIERLEAATRALEAAAKDVEGAFETMKNDGTVPPAEIAEFYFYAYETYEQTDLAAKRVYHVKDGLSKFLIPERLRAQGMDGIRVPSIARSFGITTKTSASLLDKERGFEWLRKIGQGDVIQETVNASTLSALVRNMILEHGIDPPGDIVKVSTYAITSMVKYKPKAGEA